MMFSIVVPVYNVEVYLTKCIDSILMQSYPNFELILVNDGSTDNSPMICDKYAKKDHRVKVVHKHNGGLSSARNEGLAKSTGEYILFVDSDDFWKHNHVLEEINTIIVNENSDIVLYGFSYYFSENKIIEKRLDFNIASSNQKNLDLLVANDIYQASACNKCIKRDLLIENKLYFPLSRLSEDITWCAKLMLVCKNYSIYNDAVYMYRQNRKGSITSIVSEKNILDIFISIGEVCKLASDHEISKHFLYIYASRYYLEVMPYIGDYFNTNNSIRAYVYEYKFLLSYANKLNIRNKRIVLNFIRALGIEKSIIVLYYLVYIYKRIMKK